MKTKATYTRKAFKKDDKSKVELNHNFCHACRKWVVAKKAPKRFDVVWTCPACEKIHDES